MRGIDTCTCLTTPSTVTILAMYSFCLRLYGEADEQSDFRNFIWCHVSLLVLCDKQDLVRSDRAGSRDQEERFGCLCI